ncbi:hypothetical protein [Amycolatopsis australiensis]|uniref:Uncharacterized protein n=1 Tax=Amycolatopsis australiensis TaxID=546364 RepID=A0A1K1RMD1_9PSEU|nr:hypothetical protein [Amycolatopsis australiensis]SFW73312.1 hypothetical protein SAMN04489730_3593 [Amycolatopsis australiensis]
MTLESEDKSPKTIRCYTHVARKFHAWPAEPIAPLEAADPRAWLDRLPTPPEGPEDYRDGHVKASIADRLATTSPGNANSN